ncbi:MAG TPA: acetyl-CoA carboxylase biotin carboxyl carrier protein [Acidobacteriaceae bacterium]|jgi:acetyl-CoA carboxylase biotin carboxyl carrier protein|nr:acetyl-CoA carboxylase biotin carboxyl carrier protein [Acidobacteriaceae bacterium]
MDQNNLQELRELVDFLKSNGIAEFDMERADLKVRIKFAAAVSVAADPVQLAALLASAGGGLQAQSPAAALASAAPASTVPEEKLHEVKSPIVGTFYESPSPGAPAFVKVGDQVEVGQVLCIVEAMKLMNEIESDVAGEIVKRIATSGQPVEYGQPLFAIKPR